VKIDKLISLQSVNGIALAAVLTLTVAGCGDEDTPLAPPVDTGPTTHTVTVTVASAIVIASCENDPTNPGDFTFELVVRESGVDQADWKRFNGSFSGLAGQAADFDDIVFTMEREPKTNDFFMLEFHLYEWDTNGLYDDRMADSIGYSNHYWQGGRDWKNGPETISVSGSSECRVQMVCSVEVE